MKRRKLKKAPKIILILLIIFLIIVGITINQNNKTPNSEQKLTQEEKILQKRK